MRQRTSIVATLVLGATAWAASAAASGPPFEFAVRKDQVFGASRGTLVFDQAAIEYKTTDRKDARRWAYEQVKQVQVRSPRRLRILTYEDQGWLKLGADRTYEFEVTQGTIGADFVAFLLERIERPVVTAVMPPLPGEPRFRVPVKHQRLGRGSDGTLVLYDDRLVYLTERETEARHWRLGDLFSVLLLDRDRLEVRAYEGGGGATRPFVFELKTALPVGFYDALWQQVNRPTAARQPGAEWVLPQDGKSMAIDRAAASHPPLAPAAAGSTCANAESSRRRRRP